MAGQGDRLRQKTFGLGNTPSEKRERLGEGRERRRRRRRGAGQSRPVGIHGILNPSIGHCPQAGLLSPEVASWKVAWGAQGGPGGTAHPPTPSAVRETWSVFPKIHATLAVFIQAPATSCQEPVNDERFF